MLSLFWFHLRAERAPSSLQRNGSYALPKRGNHLLWNSNHFRDELLFPYWRSGVRGPKYAGLGFHHCSETLSLSHTQLQVMSKLSHCFGTLLPLSPTFWFAHPNAWKALAPHLKNSNCLREKKAFLLTMSSSLLPKPGLNHLVRFREPEVRFSDFCIDSVTTFMT